MSTSFTCRERLLMHCHIVKETNLIYIYVIKFVHNIKKYEIMSLCKIQNDTWHILLGV